MTRRVTQATVAQRAEDRDGDRADRDGKDGDERPGPDPLQQFRDSAEGGQRRLRSARVVRGELPPRERGPCLRRCSGRRRGPGTSSRWRSLGSRALRASPVRPSGSVKTEQLACRRGSRAEHSLDCVRRPRRSTVLERSISAPGGPSGLLVVGVLAGRVVGRVDHVDDLGDLLLDGLRDAFLERRRRGGAAVAAAAHLQDHGVAASRR